MFIELMALEAIAEGRFMGAAAPDKGQRTFGGQFLAQALGAAQRSVAPDRQVHSLHAYFLRPGDVDETVELIVEVVRDGRSFSSRQVRALQHGKEVFRMMVSLQEVPDDTPRYAAQPMPAVPPPEVVTLTYDALAAAAVGKDKWHGAERPIDIRYINPPGERDQPVTESQLMWMRIDERLPDDGPLHQAGLAYLSDATLVDHVTLPHGLRWHDEDFDGASLDHAMWFYRPARADEWLLYVQDAQATGYGRGLSKGQYFDSRGNLVAVCMQEGLMRWAPK